LRSSNPFITSSWTVCGYSSPAEILGPATAIRAGSGDAAVASGGERAAAAAEATEGMAAYALELSTLVHSLAVAGGLAEFGLGLRHRRF
jgi:hypothetical protein